MATAFEQFRLTPTARTLPPLSGLVCAVASWLLHPQSAQASIRCLSAEPSHGPFYSACAFAGFSCLVFPFAFSSCQAVIHFS
jgi:hypothetical protein